ncbi:Piwi-domain-containing protein [Byssothecium circinans]|uniref:Piwi-domain-containing protein n=1 Tax=Byssothecium circinans TaxID=147558 RepID=A0A6A5UM29_9PLEO|nr:Piwi-domain-containing protein [Byssothecium circinans]
MGRDRLRDWARANKGRLPSNIIYYRDEVGHSQYKDICTKELPQIRKAFTHIQNEKGVTRPCYFDFYLQSHKAFKGTAKPTCYFVLENEMGFSPKVLQDFTNAPCLTYMRFCGSVSYVPPVYYADRLCEKARTYIKGDRLDLKRLGLELPEMPKRDKDESGDAFMEKEKQFSILRDEWEGGVVREWRKKAVWQGNGKEGPSTNHVGPWHPELNNSICSGCNKGG